jgi:hypothetical protein
MKYVKKPVEIEAVKILAMTEDEIAFDDHEPEQIDWVLKALEKEIGSPGALWIDARGAIVGTLEGNMRAKTGDYIVRGVKGEIYPVRADIFAETYEPVT